MRFLDIFSKLINSILLLFSIFCSCYFTQYFSLKINVLLILFIFEIIHKTSRIINLSHATALLKWLHSNAVCVQVDGEMMKHTLQEDTFSPVPLVFIQAVREMLTCLKSHFTLTYWSRLLRTSKDSVLTWFCLGYLRSKTLVIAEDYGVLFKACWHQVL